MSQQTNQTNDLPEGNKKNFEDTYLKLRQAEGQVYADAEVAKLPKAGRGVPFKSTWAQRAKSAGRLASYLKGKRKALNILEIGCGTGWLAAKLAGIPNAKVTAIDVVGTEVEQASRVFKKDNLHFLTGTIFDAQLAGQTFDAIVFVGSMQFVPKARDILKHAVTILNPRGEIHVMDIPLYHDRQVMAAAQRARDHYDTLKLGDMAKHHHHYSLDIFRELNYRILIDPRKFWSKLKGEKFFWVKIYKS